MKVSEINESIQSPELTGAQIAAARRRLERAGRLLLLTHIGPDGDAVGSMLGLGLALRATGKDVMFVCADQVPDTFRFLPAYGEIATTPRGTFEVVVSLDAADRARLGTVGEQLKQPIDLLFDHHITNPGFAEINLIDVTAASTAELVTELLPALGLPLTKSAAECLLTGLITDTMGFRTSSTTAKTLALAQKLVEAGASLPEIYDLAFYKRSIHAVRLWAQGLARLQLDHRIVWTALPLSARQAAQYHGQGDADLINVLQQVREADVALILTEREEGKVKVSWRAVPGVNVAAIAATFGGGGHVAAAGAEVTGPLEDVIEKVLAATRAALNGKSTA
jgi:phosphoesterase RecJ-like protein